jgi:hypothetical protein
MNAGCHRVLTDCAMNDRALNQFIAAASRNLAADFPMGALAGNGFRQSVE